MALNGVSFLATKKTVSSHAVSVIAQKDCALWRILKLDDICSDQPIPNYGETLAVAYSYPGADRSTGIDVLSTGRTSLVAPAVAGSSDAAIESLAGLEPALAPEPDLKIEDAAAMVLASYAPAAGPESVRTVRPSTKPVVPVRPMAKDKSAPVTLKQVVTLSKGRYLILGSFHDRKTAAQHMRKLGSYDLAIMTANVKGKTAYRVAAGPYVDSASLFLARRHFTSTGVPDAWALTL